MRELGEKGSERMRGRVALGDSERLKGECGLLGKYNLAAHLEYPFDGVLPPLKPHPPHHLVRHLVRQARELDVEGSQGEVRRTNGGRIEVRDVDRFVVRSTNEIGCVGESLSLGDGACWQGS